MGSCSAPQHIFCVLFSFSSNLICFNLQKILYSLPKGLYTGHFNWDTQTTTIDKGHEHHAKIFEFKPEILDGGKDKDK